jgi:hypothetical protein
MRERERERERARETERERERSVLIRCINKFILKRKSSLEKATEGHLPQLFS